MVKSQIYPLAAACISALALFLLVGCTSKSSSHHDETRRTEAAQPLNPLQRQLDGGTYCVQTFLQGQPPAASLHFSNKVTESDGSGKDFEANLSGDTFDVTIHDRHAVTDFDRESSKIPGSIPVSIKQGMAETTITNHYKRSDEVGWRTGGNGIALGGTPWSLFVSKPTVTEAGTETINGFETVKYTIDTTHQTAMDKAALLAAGRLKDYNITGAAWETKDTKCVLQYNIDYEEDGNDGKVRKTHYEGSVSKN